MSALDVGIGAAPATAAAVANEFLRLSRLESGLPPIDQMKLQKLLFYAHAWHLAIKEQPLFQEDFEAWPWGPVVRNVYLQTRKFGRQPITGLVEELKIAPTESFLNARFETPQIEESNLDLKEFIKAVWDAHKHLTGVQLSNATHADGEPWTIVKEQYGSLEGKPSISNELIAAVFKKKIPNAANTDSES